MIIPHWSCYYKIPQSFLYCSENTLCLLPSSSLPHEYPLQINSRTYRVSAHPQLFMCFTKVFKILFDLPKILWSLWLLKFLLACIMVNPISLVVLMTFLVIIILSLLTQYVANASNHQLILLNYLSSSDVFQTWAGSRPNYLSSIVPLVYTIDPSLIRKSSSDPLFWKS